MDNYIKELRERIDDLMQEKTRQISKSLLLEGKLEQADRKYYKCSREYNDFYSSIERILLIDPKERDDSKSIELIKQTLNKFLPPKE